MDVAASERLTRIGLLADALGVARDGLAHAATETGIVADRVLAGVDREFSSIALDGAWHEPSAAWLDAARAAYPATARAIDALVEPAGQRRIAIRGDRDVAMLALVTITPEIGADIPSALGLDGDRAAHYIDFVDQLYALAETKRFEQVVTWFGDPPAIGVRIAAAPADDAGRRRLLVGISQLAEDQGATAAQVRLLSRIHHELARDRPVGLTIRITPAGLSQGLTVTYAIDSWDTGLRVMQGLTLSDAEVPEIGRRLGQVAGVLDADKPTALSLALGPHEPPGVVVWAELVASIARTPAF
jgi:hypothetical protein